MIQFNENMYIFDSHSSDSTHTLRGNASLSPELQEIQKRLDKEVRSCTHAGWLVIKDVEGALGTKNRYHFIETLTSRWDRGWVGHYLHLSNQNTPPLILNAEHTSALLGGIKKRNSFIKSRIGTQAAKLFAAMTGVADAPSTMNQKKYEHLTTNSTQKIENHQQFEQNEICRLKTLGFTIPQIDSIKKLHETLKKQVNEIHPPKNISIEETLFLRTLRLKLPISTTNVITCPFYDHPKDQLQDISSSTNSHASLVQPIRMLLSYLGITVSDESGQTFVSMCIQLSHLLNAARLSPTQTPPEEKKSLIQQKNGQIASQNNFFLIKDEQGVHIHRNLLQQIQMLLTSYKWKIPPLNKALTTSSTSWFFLPLSTLNKLKNSFVVHSKKKQAQNSQAALVKYSSNTFYQKPKIESLDPTIEQITQEQDEYDKQKDDILNSLKDLEINNTDIQAKIQDAISSAQAFSIAALQEKKIQLEQLIQLNYKEQTTFEEKAQALLKKLTDVASEVQERKAAVIRYIQELQKESDTKNRTIITQHILQKEQEQDAYEKSKNLLQKFLERTVSERSHQKYQGILEIIKIAKTQLGQVNISELEQHIRALSSWDTKMNELLTRKQKAINTPLAFPFIQFAHNNDLQDNITKLEQKQTTLEAALKNNPQDDSIHTLYEEMKKIVEEIEKNSLLAETLDSKLKNQFHPQIFQYFDAKKIQTLQKINLDEILESYLHEHYDMIREYFENFSISPIDFPQSAKLSHIAKETMKMFKDQQQVILFIEQISPFSLLARQALQDLQANYETLDDLKAPLEILLNKCMHLLDTLNEKDIQHVKEKFKNPRVDLYALIEAEKKKPDTPQQPLGRLSYLELAKKKLTELQAETPYLKKQIEEALQTLQNFSDEIEKVLATYQYTEPSSKETQDFEELTRNAQNQAKMYLKNIKK